MINQESVNKIKQKQIIKAIQNCETDDMRILFKENPLFDCSVSKQCLIAVIENSYSQCSPPFLTQEILRFNFTLLDDFGNILWSPNPKEWTIATNIGQMPLVDYLEIQADKYGYDSYEALYNDGMRIVGYEDVSPDMFLTEQKNSL